MGSVQVALDPVLARALTTAVSLVLLAGAYQKLRGWDSFRGALANYRLLPDALVAPVAAALPVLEAAAGVALLFDALNPAAAVLALALLLSVTGAVVVNLLRGRVDIDCGCGGIEGRQRLSWGLVARNAVLIVATLLGAQEGAARDLVWIDYCTLVLATLALYGLYACASQLLSNRPRLSDLRTLP